ncbi:pyridoxamine 5'-phosphate oxidase [Clostridia bacterium]|nr:pyridoxamine 5'-phosphate oxidase [Clostridia bacterium]
MSEILNFLNEAKVFYLATADGNKPRVRPFGFVMEFEGKLYFCTSGSKPSFEQLNANPNVEISTAIENKGWLRVSGEAVFDTRSEVSEKIFETAPQLKDMYGKPDSPALKPFYIKNGEATFSSMTAAPRTVKF